MRPELYFIEVYKPKGRNNNYCTPIQHIGNLFKCLLETAETKNLETIAIFKITPKTK